jgi:hypothetical protein
MVAACPHCALANSRKQVKSELMFGWPLDSSFCTLHVDLWSAGDENGDGSQAHLLNSRCDMTQFVVSIPFPVILTSALASVFMQDVLLKIGFCVMVVVDYGSTFKGLFREMCAILKIRFHTVARGNHQALMVERFHSFLNKAVTLETMTVIPLPKFIFQQVRWLVTPCISRPLMARTSCAACPPLDGSLVSLSTLSMSQFPP